MDISDFAWFPSSGIPIAKHPRPSWMHQFSEEQKPGLVESIGASRPTIRFRTTIFGVSTVNSTDACSNHICPHSHKCREYWMGYIRFMGGQDGLGRHLTDQETRKVMNGLKYPALRGSSSTNTKRYSCLNRARPNIFSIKSGLAYYDRDPSVGLLDRKSVV